MKVIFKVIDGLDYFNSAPDTEISVMLMINGI